MTEIITPETIDAISTPALIIDLDIMEKNIRVMADYFRGQRMSLRPHIKTHKSPVIAHKQVKAGAVGITCQTLSEAEIFAQAGFENILVSNEITAQEKIRQLVNLTTWNNVTVGIDHAENAEAIARTARAVGGTVSVALEISMGRTGVAAGDSALSLARKIAALKGLRFKGIWCHDGGMASTTSFEERKKKHREALTKFLETKRLLEKDGIPVEITSAGFTATYNLTPEFAEVTDVQAGSYVLMDWVYQTLEGLERFECALTVLTTVISKPKHQENRVYTDCGIKAISHEHTGDYTRLALPKVKGRPDAKVIALSEEHAWIEMGGPGGKPSIGDKIELIPGHCCSTCNLHDRFYGVRNGRVESVWPILGRARV
jgi:D-serine deaminase-like pyridoxal phosphate-dependent protein